MNLTVFKREVKKSATARLRRAGDIPAVIYAANKGAESIVIKGDVFRAFLRDMKPGQLSTAIFVLDLEGRKRKALVKEIQYEVTTYRIDHLDFQELIEDTEVDVKIPIICTGVADCVGIKLGGFLRQVIRSVKVRAPSHEIPEHFEIGVESLGIRQTKRLSDIEVPKGVKLLASAKEVVVVIAKR